MFDINGGGTIDADELNSALKSVDIQLTHQEIHDVLQVIDEDGTIPLMVCLMYILYQCREWRDRFSGIFISYDIY